MTSVSSGRRRGLNASTAIKSPVIAASTGNLTLSAEQTVDGIALVDGNRVFVKDQTDGTENGIYLVDTSTWAREPDWDGTGDVVEGTMVPVSRGTTNALTWWIVSNTGTITIGTTALTVVQGLTDVGISATSTVTDESTDTTCFPVFMTDATGNNALKSGTNLTFNSNTGELVSTIVTGNTVKSTVAIGTAPIAVTSTTEVANLNVEQHGGVKIKIIEIGDWDMDANASVSPAHGLTLANIRSITMLIRSDSDVVYYPGGSEFDVTGGVQQVWVEKASAANIDLKRLTGGDFDGTAYDSTSFNRGWITIHYV